MHIGNGRQKESRGVLIVTQPRYAIKSRPRDTPESMRSPFGAALEPESGSSSCSLTSSKQQQPSYYWQNVTTGSLYTPSTDCGSELPDASPSPETLPGTMSGHIARRKLAATGVLAWHSGSLDCCVWSASRVLLPLVTKKNRRSTLLALTGVLDRKSVV